MKLSFGIANTTSVFTYGTEYTIPTSNTWYRVAWQIDLTTNPSTQGYVGLRCNTINNLSSTNNTYVDGVVVLDVTDVPTVTESTFPIEFMPSAYQQLSNTYVWGGSRPALQSTVNTGTHHGSLYLTPLTHTTYHGYASYISAEQGWAQTGNVSYTSIQGNQPEMWQIVARCVTAERGFVAGDEVPLTTFADAPGRNCLSWCSANRFGWDHYAAAYYIVARDSTWNVITPANWKIVLKAYYA